MLCRAPVVLLLVLLVGCLPEAMSPDRVPDNPFAGAPIPPTVNKVSYAPAAQAVAARVDLMGRKLVADNPQMALHPLFVTIGAPQPEIFHRGLGELDITEGLVKQCLTDEQLAAVLCHELGKMVAERASLTPPRVYNAMAEPPPDIWSGNVGGGYNGDMSMTNLAEHAKFRPPAYRNASSALPDPEVLARDFLTKAGFCPGTLETVAPLLKTAGDHTAWEKQLAAPGPARPWTH